MGNELKNVKRIENAGTATETGATLIEKQLGFAEAGDKMVYKDAGGSLHTFSQDGDYSPTKIENGTASVECAASADVSILPPTGSKIKVTDDVVISPVTNDNTKSVYITNDSTTSTPNGGGILTLSPSIVMLSHGAGLDNAFTATASSVGVFYGGTGRVEIDATSTDLRNPAGTVGVDVSNTATTLTGVGASVTLDTNGVKNTNTEAQYDADGTNTATVNKEILEAKLAGQTHDSLAAKGVAGAGVSFGHVNDQAQTIAGAKSFSSQITTSGGIDGDGEDIVNASSVGLETYGANLNSGIESYNCGVSSAFGGSDAVDVQHIHGNCYYDGADYRFKATGYAQRETFSALAGIPRFNIDRSTASGSAAGEITFESFLQLQDDGVLTLAQSTVANINTAGVKAVATKEYVDDLAIPFIEVTPTGDDKGLVVTEQFSVGALNDGRESVFGEGDSHPVEYAFHCTKGDTTGDTIINAVDIASILNSDSGSTTGLFGGTAVGDYILVGASAQFQGVKVKSTDCGDIEPDNVKLSSWRGSGVFFTVNFMNTNANFPYTQYGNAVCSAPSEQWRFGFDPTTPSTWAPVTININGSDITKYWGIFEITSTITTDATIEQMKIHTNRTKINADGKVEYFGLARYPRTLFSGLSNYVVNALYDPANETVDYGSEFEAKYLDNEFANNAIDGLGFTQGIVSGLDTSIPLVFSISYYVKGTGTGDIKFHIDAYQVSDGFVFDGTATPDEYDLIDTVSASSNLVRRTVSILIDVHKIKDTGDQVVISVRRDATSGEPEDTLNNNVVLENLTLTGYFWGP